MKQEELLSRARGCLVGLAIGDALGAPVEGWSARQIREVHGVIQGFLNDAAAGTDDTEYAMLTAQILIKYGRRVTLTDVANAWRDLINSGSLRGGGFSEAAAVHNLKHGLMPPASGRDNPEMWSDGTAMRIAPAGILCAGEPAEAARLAAIDAGVSHSGDGVVAAQAVAAAVAAAMGGAAWEDVVESALSYIPRDSWTRRQIERALDVAARYNCALEAAEALHNELSIFHYFWADVAPEAVALAFGAYAAAKGHYRDAVLGAVNIGRDADTIAAITGAVAGATDGFEAIPEQWSQRIVTAQGRCVRTVAGVSLVDLAEALVDRYLEGRGCNE